MDGLQHAWDEIRDDGGSGCPHVLICARHGTVGTLGVVCDRCVEEGAPDTHDEWRRLNLGTE